ncbi:MAG TPA: hypothetical protein VK762_29475 [Polyangiaceae bacterium]|jgi:hypothetical protein|nr:hypothetical protein [Polyangiaceae bacterium]
MRSSSVFTVVSCAVVFAAACSSSSNNGSPDAGNTGEDSGSDGTTSGSSSSGGASSDDSGLLGDVGFPMMMVTLGCTSAADCTDGGAQVCCFSLTSFATSCVASQCATGDYQQCASSDSECPSGDQCIVSPLGMNLHYCAIGDGGGIPEDTGTGDAGVDSAAGDAGVDSAAGDGATE